MMMMMIVVIIIIIMIIIIICHKLYSNNTENLQKYTDKKKVS